MSNYFRLLKYAKPYVVLMILGVICSSILSSTNVLLIPLVGKLSSALGARNFVQLNLFAGAAVGLYFLKGVFSFAQIYLGSHVNQDIIRDLRVELFEHLQNLSLDYYSRTKTGEIITLVMNDINAMQNVIVSSFTSVIPNIMTIIGISGYLLYLDWRLALVSIVMLPVITYVATRSSREIRNVARSMQEKISDLTSILHEVTTGAKIVKSFTMEKEEIKRFRLFSDYAKEIALKATAINATQTPLFNFFQAIAAVIVIWVGGFEVISGRISVPNLIAFFSGVLMLGEPVGGLSGMNVNVQLALISATRVFGVLDTIPTIKDDPGARDVSSLQGEVVFDKVSFKYDSNGHNILNNININCKAGEVIAVVGHSGAGKSTLVSLIPRFYDPQDGNIFIDGHTIKSYKITSLRKFIGIVPQETLLFSGTIKENIAYGRNNVSDHEIEEVARMANAHDFIMSFSEKYNTLIGEKGIRLSGGERQRIAIARAFLRDPKILILDEATSSLDSESEHCVQEALEKLMSGRTTFVIAHRLSTVHFANRILVLSKGEIVEEGTHKELIDKDGAYKRFYDMQMGKFARTLTDIVGFIEPHVSIINYGNTSYISGWTLPNDRTEISKVHVMHYGKVVGTGKVGIERPDIQKAYPNVKNSIRSGFSVEFSASENPAEIYSIEFFDNKGRKVNVLPFKLSEFDNKTTVSL